VVVEIPLTQEMLATVKPAAPVTIAAGGGEPLRASITRISPFLAEGSRSTVAEIELANAHRRLRPGMSVKVDVVHGESSRGTLVPLSALYEDPQSGQISLFVVANMNAGAGEQARPVVQRSIEVVARGAGTAAVTGINEGEWVVSIGQHLLAREQSRTARVRPATWERVLQLQGLQREDLLAGYLEKQQTIARAHGAEPPTSAVFLGAKR